MKPIKFKGHNMILAEDQPQYQPLPVCAEFDGSGAMTSCWKLNFRERLLILFTGMLYFRQLTFGRSFQPIMPMVEWEEGRCINCGAPVGEHKQKTGFTCPPKPN